MYVAGPSLEKHHTNVGGCGVWLVWDWSETHNPAWNSDEWTRSKMHLRESMKMTHGEITVKSRAFKSSFSSIGERLCTHSHIKPVVTLVFLSLSVLSSSIVVCLRRGTLQAHNEAGTQWNNEVGVSQRIKNTEVLWSWTVSKRIPHRFWRRSEQLQKTPKSSKHFIHLL